MKRNLNLIATAASLILLGLPGESQAFQNSQDTFVGYGTMSSGTFDQAKAQPAIVKSERKLISELKPLTMPKPREVSLLGQTTAQQSAQSSGLRDAKSSVSARLPDAGMPDSYAGKSGVPPIIRSSSRRLVQGNMAADGALTGQSNISIPPKQLQPPIIKPASRRLTQADGVGIIPSAVQSGKTGPSSKAVAYYPQGSSTRSFQGSAPRTPLPPIESSAAPLPYGGETPVFSEPVAQSVIDQSSISNSTPEYFSGEAGIAGQPVFEDGGCATCAPVVSNEGACASCGTGMTDGVCPTCGPGAGYLDGPVIEDFGTFGLISAARCYLHAEALLFTRGDGDIAGPEIGALNDFDSGAGLRLTFGRKSDSIAGRELGVFLLSEVSEDSTIANSPFLAEDSQQQSKESKLYSIEYNRVNYGWDVVKTFAGFKFLRFDDSYRILSTDEIDANNSFASLDAVNNLFGAHLGAELFYDIGYRWSGSIKGSWGLYANFNDFDSSNGLSTGPLFTNESTQGTISTAAELSVLAHYQIQTDIRFQVGYNLIFLGNVATVADNLVQQVPSLNGIAVTDSDDALFHGLSFGLEFYR